MCSGCARPRVSMSRWRRVWMHIESCYNAALQERRDGWSHSKTRIRYCDQSAQLSGIRSVRPDQAVWSFSVASGHARRFEHRVRQVLPPGEGGPDAGVSTVQGQGPVRTVWNGPRTVTALVGCPSQRRVYLQGVGQVKVHLHRQVAGRVKTIQIKRQGRHWMLVLSCEDKATSPLRVTGRQAVGDVGIVSVRHARSDGQRDR